MTEQPHPAATSWLPLVWLATIVVVFLGLVLAALSLWFAPVVGLLLVALGLTGGKAGLPRPLAVTVLVIGSLLLVLSVLAFMPA